jgi:CubicO group peptidase (beta-lactamase class C family)
MNKFYALLFSLLLFSCASHEHTTKNGPGYQLMVIKNNKVVQNSSFGLADIKKNISISEKTRFRLASDTKAFTGAAILFLEEAGKIKHDDPIGKYFPEFPEELQAITVAQLLEHKSGLPDFGVLCKVTDELDSIVTNVVVLNWLVKNPKLNSRPGEKFEYSNLGYLLLASLVERVTKKTFPEYVTEKIFKPLGMKDSFFTTLQTEKLPNVAKGYGSYPQFEPRQKNTCNYTYGEDGIYTNIVDFSKWAKFNSKGKVFREKLKSTDYSYGWTVTENNKRKIYAHSGSWMGFRTYARYYPKEDFWILILGNYPDVPFYEMSEEIEKHFLP